MTPYEHYRHAEQLIANAEGAIVEAGRATDEKAFRVKTALELGQVAALCAIAHALLATEHGPSAD